MEMILAFLLKFGAPVGAILLVWRKIKAIYKRLEPLLEPFIKDVEERAKDGIIDRRDRKEVAMTFISNAQAVGQLKKFNFFERLIVSKVIDYVAGKLPDFKFNPKPDELAK